MGNQRAPQERQQKQDVTGTKTINLAGVFHPESEDN